MKLTYEQWKRLVDYYCVKVTGMDTEMLPDYNYRGAYDQGITPYTVARKVLRAAKDY